MDHIVILGTAYPYRGGLASFNEMLARTFTRKGKDVQIITFKLQYPELLFPGKTQFSDSPSPDDLHITRMVSSVNPFNWIRIGRYIRKQRPDMVILKYWTPFMAPCLGTICRIIRKNKHTVIISQLDNVIPHEKHFYDGWLTRYFVRTVDGFIYMSRQVKDDLDLFTTGKPSVFAPHPVFSNFGEKVSKEAACEHLDMATDLNYVLFFGLIRDYKGLDLMIDAWGELKKNGVTQGKKLLIAGEFYTDKTKYLQQIEKLGLNNDVLLHDWFIKDEEVKYYFSLADMVVQPYKSATQSGVTQIAYQFDVPMVVTDVGGLSEIVPDHKVGLVVPPDSSAIAQAIEEIYSQHYLPDFRVNMETEKLRFSWDYFTGKITELYQTITEKPHS
ncbi:MAG: glycosyltransferase [Bacteroidales bacterium]|jgi:glycosyltransferase involved in cell wall biosynthesis|nr:glycosyltransferase [Bacteroidales bacterium]